MKYTFLAFLALIACAVAPAVFAQSAYDASTAPTVDVTVSANTTSIPVIPTPDQTQATSPDVFTPTPATPAQTNAQILADELTQYQLKAADPSVGWFAKTFIIYPKIHQLQAELNLQQALQ